MIDESWNGEERKAVRCWMGGMDAEKDKDFVRAEELYADALEIYTNQGNGEDAADICCYLARLAEKKREFGKAESWYAKALAVYAKQGDEEETADVHYNLRRIAERQKRDKEGV